MFALRFAVFIKTRKHSSRIPLHTQKNIAISAQYECNICNWIYDESKGDPEGGIAP